jgi:hypothetical protein
MTATDDDDPPQGPIADFAAELHSRAEGLLIEAPFTLTPPPGDDEPAERQQPLLFQE